MPAGGVNGTQYVSKKYESMPNQAAVEREARIRNRGKKAANAKDEAMFEDLNVPTYNYEDEQSSPVTIWRLAALLKSEQLTIGAGTIIALGSTVLELMIPLIMGKSFTALTEGSKKEQIDKQVGILGMIMAGLFVLYITEQLLLSLAARRLVTRVQKQLFSSLLRQEIGFHDAHGDGELNSRLTTDTVFLNTMLSAFSDLISALAQGAGAMGFMFKTSWRLSLISLAPTPILITASVLYTSVTAKISKKTLDVLAEGSQISVESIQQVRLVRYFCQEKTQVISYARYADAVYILRRKMVYIGAIYSSISSTLGNLAYLFQLWYGLSQVRVGKAKGGLDIGDLFSYLYYVQSAQAALGNITALYTNMVEAIGVTQRMMDMLERKPLIHIRGGEIPAKVQGRIEFEKVRFRFPTRPDKLVLQGLSFKLEPGKTLALVGPSGSGKSTIVQLLMQLYPIEDGRITFDKRDISEIDATWLRRQVGIVSQEPVLFSFSLSRNISFGLPEADNSRIVEAAKLANCHDFIMSFPDKYDTRVGDQGVQLSGGQRQRIAIARALISNPKVLIFDEATSALDSTSEQIVQKAIDKLTRNRTVIMIAHRLSTVTGADTILVVKDGKDVERGTHNELLRKNGIYANLVKKQMAAKKLDEAKEKYATENLLRKGSGGKRR